MNKPIKQTVYLPVQENIIFHTEHFKKKEGYFFTPEELNKYTQTVIKQTLETAVEKAYVTYVDLETNEEFDYTDVITDDGVGADVNKQSITNTFEETFKKFEV